MGKNAAGEDIPITVEHEPYTGEQPLEFTFNPANELIVQPAAKVPNKDDLTNSNAVVEVESVTNSGTVKFSENANTEASIIFSKINTKDRQTLVEENEPGKAVVSVIDTRTGEASQNEWNVRTKLSDGPFGNKGFLLNNLGVVLTPSTQEESVTTAEKVTMNDNGEYQAFSVAYKEGSNERKAVTLNPQLTVGDTNLLQSGVYGANITWTLTPKV
nr:MULTISPECIES: hypothetical protein [unclassified Enterococcus]